MRKFKINLMFFVELEFNYITLMLTIRSYALRLSRLPLFPLVKSRCKRDSHILGKLLSTTYHLLPTVLL